MSAAPAETGASFGENALAKARYGLTLAPLCCWVLGEDSGLVVEALDGAPGIRSARFAGADATDERNVALLLEQLTGARDRRARFCCAVACLSSRPPGDESASEPAEPWELCVEGTLDGEISLGSRGEAGFGYDPVFVPAGERMTVAELGDSWKRLGSHRARAATELLGRLDRW